MILWATSAGAPGLAEPLIWILVHALGGLTLGFMIHELAHLIALRVLAPVSYTHLTLPTNREV